MSSSPTLSGAIPGSVAIINAPNTFTQDATGHVPITVQMKSGAPLGDIAWQIIPSAAAFGALPVYIKNDGGFFTPAEITATGAGQSGPGTVGSVVGNYSWMIAAISDLGANQPCYISQVTTNTNWHFLAQNGNVQIGFLISGGADHPLNEGTPTMSWSQTSTPGHVWDTRLYRWAGATGGPALATNDRMAILAAPTTGVARLLFGDRSTGTHFDLKYDVGSNSFILRDEAHSIDVFTVGNAQSGDLKISAPGLGFFGVTPIAKPTITGAKGGNAALTSLISQLVALGLIADSTT